MKIGRLVGVVCAAVLCLTVAAPVFPGPRAGAEASSATEKLVARHDKFDFPDEFQTIDGKRLPKGTYDLALIEAEGKYFIQLTDRSSGKGTRVAAEATGRIEGDWLGRAEETQVSIRSDKGQNALLFSCGNFTASFPIQEIRKKA